MQKICPCKGCETREAGCHSSCESYQGWKSERDKMKAAQTEQAAADYRFRNYRQAVYDRNERIRKIKMER